jgi:methionyl-tRNA formyltransferase
MSQKPIISFWGTPPLAASLLRKLHACQNFEIAFTVSQPDKARSHRGREVQPSAVKLASGELQIPCLTPKSLRKEESIVINKTTEQNVDCHVILAYGKILSKSIIEQPSFGSINFHGSLLPDYRGASPIESALKAGDKVSGYTVQKISEELDAGDILAKELINIDVNDNRSSLFDKICHRIEEQGPRNVLDYLQGKLKAIPQEHEKATFCGKFEPKDGLIDWDWPAFKIFNLARAFSPRPGVYSFFQGKRCKLQLASVETWENTTGQTEDHAPGTIVQAEKNRIIIAAGGNSTLAFSGFQFEGRKMCSSQEFLNGTKAKAGMIFSSGINIERG